MSTLQRENITMHLDLLQVYNGKFDGFLDKKFYSNWEHRKDADLALLNHLMQQSVEYHTSYLKKVRTGKKYYVMQGSWDGEYTADRGHSEYSSRISPSNWFHFIVS